MFLSKLLNAISWIKDKVVQDYPSDGFKSAKTPADYRKLQAIVDEATKNRKSDLPNPTDPTYELAHSVLEVWEEWKRRKAEVFIHEPMPTEDKSQKKDLWAMKNSKARTKKHNEKFWKDKQFK